MPPLQHDNKRSAKSSVGKRRRIEPAYPEVTPAPPWLAEVEQLFSTLCNQFNGMVKQQLELTQHLQSCLESLSKLVTSPDTKVEIPSSLLKNRLREKKSRPVARTPSQRKKIRLNQNAALLPTITLRPLDHIREAYLKTPTTHVQFERLPSEQIVLMDPKAIPSLKPGGKRRGMRAQKTRTGSRFLWQPTLPLAYPQFRSGLVSPVILKKMRNRRQISATHRTLFD